MLKIIKLSLSLFLLSTFGLLACQDAMLPAIDEGELQQTAQAIINGERVTGNDMLSTVSLLIDGNDSMCTGTLISPRYVLTAAHCISNCVGSEPIEDLRRWMSVGVGQGEREIKRQFEIEAFYPHKDFVCTDYDILNDIALLKLKTPVPLSLVTPTPPMPPQFDLTVGEVDKTQISLLTAGFGLTDPEDPNSSGKKFKTYVDVYALCSLKRGGSRGCGQYGTEAKGFVYFNSTQTGTCQGDSGGPSFMSRNGVEYVVGVTSFGFDKCMGLSASTLVSDYYSFIAGIATDIAAGEPEICDNGIDDNGDGRVDCADPYCFALLRCIPEDCGNGVDDNGNNLVDCADPQCSDLLMCQEEICNNGIDDNGDGKIDCLDAACSKSLYCVAEICNNGIDDNGNDLVDCDDKQCQKSVYCQPEVCHNGVDDNKNGLIDCADPSCAKAPICLPEICDNGIDDNGDGKTDCDDVKCKDSDKCRVEDCRNGIDDTGNGLIDCADPSCAAAIICKREICDNGIDDNGDRLQDCDDPQCAESPLCVVTKEGSPSTCSATPRGLGGGAGHGLWAGLILLAFAWRRRSVVVRERLKDV